MLTELRTDIGEDRGFFNQFANCGLLKNHWDDDLLAKVAEEFPYLDDPGWVHLVNSKERIFVGDNPRMWGDATNQLLAAMGGNEFLDLLTELTGISGLIPHTFEGGLRVVEHGGFQLLHNQPNYNFIGWRRLQVRVFLSIDSEPEGEFFVYDNPNPFPAPGAVLPEKESLLLAAVPHFNHTAIFETTRTTFHGQPIPIESFLPNKSVILNYYTERSAVDGASNHRTIWWNS